MPSTWRFLAAGSLVDWVIFSTWRLVGVCDVTTGWCGAGGRACVSAPAAVSMGAPSSGGATAVGYVWVNGATAVGYV